MIAFSSLVYSAEPVPALTRFTLTFGYCCSNAFTMSAVCGAQAHTVSVVGCCRAAAMADAPVPPVAGLLALAVPPLAAAARAA